MYSEDKLILTRKGNEHFAQHAERPNRLGGPGQASFQSIFLSNPMYPEQLCEDAELLGQDDKSLLSLIYELLHVKEESLMKGMMACICYYQYVLIICILGT